MPLPSNIPPATVEGAILRRFRDMSSSDRIAFCQIGDGSRHPDDRIVRPGRQSQPPYRQQEKTARRWLEVGQPRRTAARARAVAGLRATFPVAPPPPRPFHPSCHLGAALRLSVVAELGKRNRRHLDLNVEAVEQRTRNAAPVRRDDCGCAAARPVAPSKLAARTRVHDRFVR